MQKKTPDYDSVFKTMKIKHKRLFISVINNTFGKNYPMDANILKEPIVLRKQQPLHLFFQTDRQSIMNQ